MRNIPLLFEGLPDGGMAHEGYEGKVPVLTNPTATLSKEEIVSFPSGELTLGGIIYKPNGPGPFPAILYNHGSAPGMLNNKVSDVLGPIFASRGWVFFMPYRRGQGLSASAGPYIMDQVGSAQKTGGLAAGAAVLTRLLNTDHLNDQLAALAWLKAANFVQASRVAVAGNSLGGIEAVLGAQYGTYCAAVDASGGAMSWESAPELRALMKEAVRSSQAPIFFFQAENDYDLRPSKTLSEAMKIAGKEFQIKIYPSFGKTEADGHSFAYLGSALWIEDVMQFLEQKCKK